MIYLVFICFITVSIDDKNVQIPKIRSSPKKVYIRKKRFQSVDFLRSQNTCKVKSEIVGLIAICIICRSGGKIKYSFVVRPRIDVGLWVQYFFGSLYDKVKAKSTNENDHTLQPIVSF